MNKKLQLFADGLSLVLIHEIGVDIDDRGGCFCENIIQCDTSREGRTYVLACRLYWQPQ